MPRATSRTTDYLRRPTPLLPCRQDIAPSLDAMPRPTTTPCSAPSRNATTSMSRLRLCLQHGRDIVYDADASLEPDDLAVPCLCDPSTLTICTAPQQHVAALTRHRAATLTTMSPTVSTGSPKTTFCLMS